MTDSERRKAHLADPSIPDTRDSLHQHRLASHKQMGMIKSICNRHNIAVPSNLTELTAREAGDFITYYLNNASIQKELRWWDNG